MGRFPRILVVVAALVTPASSAFAQRPARPTVSVLDFDYGSLQTQWWGQQDIGRGVAARLVDVFVEDGRLRLIERTAIETVLGEQDFAATNRADPDAATLARIGRALGVRYVVAGSITKFATSDRKFGGGHTATVGRALLGPVGGLSFRKAKQEVALTARLIDTTTGQVVASATGAGVAKKGQGVALEGGAPGETGFVTESAEFRASGMGQAQDLAVAELARGLLARVADLSVEAPPVDTPVSPTPSAEPQATRSAAAPPP